MLALARRPILVALRWPILASVLLLIVSLIVFGSSFAVTVAILGVLEFVFSFDNAVVNSKILTRMSPFWRHAFLTVGIIIAVFGMRLAFPLLIVMITAHMKLGAVWHQALYQPDLYAANLQAAHPAIAAFGGIFLLMIFLDWLFDEEHVLFWLGSFERRLCQLGKVDVLSSVIALLSVWVIAEKFSGPHTLQVLAAGVIGWISYEIVNILDSITEQKADEESAEEVFKRHGTIKLATGAAGLVLLLKLELIDASFSFDGVTGAFAISSNIIAIMFGLGIGAFFIRSLTVYLTNEGTLGEYVFLDHGAHWAIGALAIVLLSMVQLPEYITGFLGILLIGASFWSSLRYRKQHPELFEQDDAADDSNVVAFPEVSAS